MKDTMSKEGIRKPLEEKVIHQLSSWNIFTFLSNGNHERRKDIYSRKTNVKKSHLEEKSMIYLIFLKVLELLFYSNNKP